MVELENAFSCANSMVELENAFSYVNSMLIFHLIFKTRNCLWELTCKILSFEARNETKKLQKSRKNRKT